MVQRGTMVQRVQFVLAPSAYVTVSDRTCISQRYHMYGNPMRISILL